ncbi:MAG: hypothetical protein MK358_13615, partial [Vicinamibacterales bacterium]|nr:hypothetical protein [Vicinamibacterales bacterium]
MIDEVQWRHDPTDRRRRQLRLEVGLLIMINPVSLRYAIDYEGYALFQAHIPRDLPLLPIDGPIILHGCSGPPPPTKEEAHKAPPHGFLDPGPEHAESWRPVLET